MPYILRHTRRQAVGGWLDPRAVLVGEVQDKLDALHRHDFPVGPGVVQVVAVGRPHANERRSTLAEVHLGARRREERRTPPAFHQLGFAPGAPYLFDLRVKSAGYDQIVCFRIGAHLCSSLRLRFVIAGGQPGTMPQVTFVIVPVMPLAQSEARNAAVFATSARQARVSAWSSGPLAR